MTPTWRGNSGRKTAVSFNTGMAFFCIPDVTWRARGSLWICKGSLSEGITRDLQRQPEHLSGGEIPVKIRWGFIPLVDGGQLVLGAPVPGATGCWTAEVWRGGAISVCRARNIGSSFGSNPAGAVRSQGCAMPFAELCRRKENKSAPVVWKEENWIYRQSMALSTSLLVKSACYIFCIVLDESGAEILHERVFWGGGGRTKNLGWSPIFKQ